MRAEYDLIVLDTPPLLAATDALVLAPLADTTVFLVRWGSTPRAVVVHALQMLVREGVAIAGSVLSRVEMRKYRAWGEKEHGHLFAQYRNDAAKQPA
jgi:Mrp family chromosome partitioning ATPase